MIDLEDELWSMLSMNTRTTGVENAMIWVRPELDGDTVPCVKVTATVRPPKVYDFVLGFDGALLSGEVTVPEETLADIRRYIKINQEPLKRHWDNVTSSFGYLDEQKSITSN